MSLPREVRPLFDALRTAVGEALADNLVGVYLCGSLAHGLRPCDQYVDVVVVTERPRADAELVALEGVHAEMPPSFEVLDLLAWAVNERLAVY